VGAEAEESAMTGAGDDLRVDIKLMLVNATDQILMVHGGEDAPSLRSHLGLSGSVSYNKMLTLHSLNLLRCFLFEVDW
jgi:hypothetical protein